MKLILLLLSTSLTFAGTYDTQEAPKSATLAAVVYSKTGTLSWLARMGELLVLKESGRFANLNAVDTPADTFASCTFGTDSCFLDLLPKDGAEILFVGQMDEQGDVQFRLLENWSQRLVSQGSIDFGDFEDQVEVKNQIFKVIKPLVSKGGLIDGQSLLPQTNKSHWPYWIVAGILWGWFILMNALYAIPRLHGMQSVLHWNLFHILKSWIEIALARSLLLVIFYMPVGLIVAIAMYSFPQVTFREYVFGIPIIGLLYLALFLLFHLLCTKKLDEWLGRKPVSEQNPWHLQIQKYFMGYHKRLGLNLDIRLLNNILFIPSRFERFASYGGGFTRPRIIINQTLLDFAMGRQDFGLNEETEDLPLSTNMKHSYIMPEGLSEESDEKTTKREKKRYQALENSRFEHVYTAPAFQSERYDNPFFGQSTGLFGAILPVRNEESVPLITNDEQDWQVLAELLTEHHAYFAKAQPEEEYDDTDPTDKDFLFGALLREIGRVIRREQLLTTVVLFFKFAHIKTPEKIYDVLHKFTGFYEKHFSGYSAFLADSFTALNHGRHHLVQHLFYERSRNTDFLTVRADNQRLLQVSNEIFTELKGRSTSVKDKDPNRATLKNRLIWLSQFYYTRLEVSFRSQLQIGIRVGIAVLSAILVFVIVKMSVDYHPTWVQRIEDQKEQLEKEKEDGKEG